MQQCKNCRNKIPDKSIYCNWCGAQQVQSRSKKAEISIPTPELTNNGKWYIRMRLNGESISVYADTEQRCRAEARAIKAGLLEKKKTAPKKTLEAAIDEYISDHSGVLSPSTIHGYSTIKRTRFKSSMNVDIFSTHNWQRAINAEAALCAPKTLKNSWGLVARILRYNHVDVPSVTLPPVPKKELSWLNHEQITMFLDAIKGQPVEFAALLALHSLRRSELLAITPAKIQDGYIYVTGSIVDAGKNGFVHKETNKNKSSTRVVPIMIPRLAELIAESTNAPNEPYVTIYPNSIYTHLQKVCQSARLPVVGLHGLRRSFASLAYHLGLSERETMLIGGWADFKTMHDIYIKLDSSDVENAAKTMSSFYVVGENGK